MNSILSLNAVFFQKNDKKIVELVSASLKGLGQCLMPNDLIEFLTYTNGFIYQELSIFGINDEKRGAKFYTLPNIIDYNKQFTFIDKKNMIIFGVIGNNFLIYCDDKKKYCNVDKINMKKKHEYDSLSSLLKHELNI